MTARRSVGSMNGHHLGSAAPMRLEGYGHPSLDFMDGSELCAQSDPEVFYVEKGGSSREAKSICALCPLIAACLQSALDRDERFGVWGGLCPTERWRLTKRIPTQHLPTDRVSSRQRRAS